MWIQEYISECVMRCEGTHMGASQASVGTHSDQFEGAIQGDVQRGLERVNRAITMIRTCSQSI